MDTGFYHYDPHKVYVEKIGGKRITFDSMDDAMQFVWKHAKSYNYRGKKLSRTWGMRE